MLKKYALLLLLLLGQRYCFAQFSQARLQATGLTCALCSKAIHQALEKLSFVQKVSAQIKESVFEITFKPGVMVAPDQIRAAVEEAGFFIGALYLTRSEGSPPMEVRKPFKEGESYFCLIEDGKRGEARTYQVLNQHFLTEKAFAKINAGSLGASLRQQPSSTDGASVFYLKSQ